MSSARFADRRRHNFFQLDNEVVDDLIEQIPEVRRADALAVYTVLCRHANEEDVAWPGVDYIARKIGRSKPTVIDAIKELGRVGLIGKEERRDEKGGQRTNVYLLLPVEKGEGVNTVNGGGKEDLRGGVNRFNTKNTKKEKDTVKNSRRDAPASPDASSRVMKDPGRYFADLLKTVGKEPTDRERERCFPHLKQLVDNQDATRLEMEQVIAKGFEAHMTGHDWWPHDTLRKLRNGNVRHLRPAEEPSVARPKKRVIS